MLQIGYNVRPTIARKRHPLFQEYEELSEHVEQHNHEQEKYEQHKEEMIKSEHKTETTMGKWPEWFRKLIELQRDEVESRERVLQDEVHCAFAIPRWEVYLLECNACKKQDILKSEELSQYEQNDNLYSEYDYKHPALCIALEKLTLIEKMEREEIEEDMLNNFEGRIKESYDYEHRVIVVRTLPLERYLRKYIYKWRASKFRQKRQLCSVIDREQIAREEMVSLSNPLISERYNLYTSFIENEEIYYRLLIEQLQLHTWCAFDMISIAFSERVERFRVLFGCKMSMARVSGRIRPHTVFFTAALLEAHHRNEVMLQETKEFNTLVQCKERDTIEHVNEQVQRRVIEEYEEKRARCDLHQLILVRLFYHSLRDLEKSENVERYALTHNLHM